MIELSKVSIEYDDFELQTLDLKISAGQYAVLMLSLIHI